MFERAPWPTHRPTPRPNPVPEMPALGDTLENILLVRPYVLAAEARWRQRDAEAEDLCQRRALEQLARWGAAP